MFNWFKRPQQPAPEPTVPEEKLEEKSEATSTEAASSPVAEDYLAWAKAAYQNIQKQKEGEEVKEVKEVEEVEGEVGADETEAIAVDLVQGETRETLPETVEVVEAIIPILPEAPPEVTPEIPLESIAEGSTETPVEAVEEKYPEIPGEAEVIGEDSPEISVETESIGENSPEISIEAVEAIEISPEIALELPIESTTEIIPEAIPETTPLPFWARETETERLARLESLVVEEEEPSEVVPEMGAEPIPGLAFDESFLWSAQVLAAQGRRPEDISVEEISWLKRLRQGLAKTRLSLINQLKSIVGQGPLDKDAVEAIEALLLQADVGVEATDYIITTLQGKLREEVLPPDQAIAYLKQILRDLLDQPYQNNYAPTFVPEKDTLNIWMMTGVNGAGKTTTIGKLAHLAQKSGYSCLIGAADTFRAAAVEQVKIWGARSGTEVIANPGQNTDPGAVVFDAIAAAQARNTELLLIDTAGRLQNKKNLMDELGKIRRIVDKKAPHAKVESLLVLDATLGQNGLRQAQVFAEAAKLSGVVLTKLDGTAKGGVALAVVQQLGLPIRFIGAGEGIEDLRPFSSYEFVEALLNG